MDVVFIGKSSIKTTLLSVILKMLNTSVLCISADPEIQYASIALIIEAIIKKRIIGSNSNI